MIEVVNNFEQAKMIVKTLSRGCQDLGIIYPEYIKEAVLDNRFIVYKINDIVIGFAMYSIRKRIKKVDLDYIYVSEDRRNKRVASQLIKYIYYSTQSLYSNMNYVMRIKVYEFSESNKFFNKIAYREDYKLTGTSNVGIFTYIMLPNQLAHLKI